MILVLPNLMLTVHSDLLAAPTFKAQLQDLYLSCNVMRRLTFLELTILSDMAKKSELSQVLISIRRHSLWAQCQWALQPTLQWADIRKLVCTWTAHITLSGLLILAILTTVLKDKVSQCVLVNLFFSAMPRPSSTSPAISRRIRTTSELSTKSAHTLSPQPTRHKIWNLRREETLPVMSPPDSKAPKTLSWFKLPHLPNSINQSRCSNRQMLMIL